MSFQAQIQLADKILKSIQEDRINQKAFQASHEQATREMQEIRASQKAFQASHEQATREMQEIRASQKAFQASQKAFQASHEQATREMQEIRASQKAFQASQEKTDKMIQKVGGRFNERWGHLVESLVKGKLVQLFQEKGIDVTELHENSLGTWRIPGAEPKTKEIDILVANGTEAVVVEVKTTLCSADIDDFLETLSNFKKYFKRFKKEIIYGAMAFLKSENKAHLKAEEKGLFIIKATGDSASLVNKKGFKPKAFC